MKAMLPKYLEKRIARLEKQIQRIPFYILVWGAGPSGGADYDKRIKIREHLIEKFGADSVLMSEDTPFLSLVETYGNRVAEAIQAEAIDAVVCLNSSIGPHTEILQYEDSLVGKAIVFVPLSHKNSRSFATIAYDALKTEGYTPDEYKDCTEIRRKANDFVQTLRFKKFRGKSSS